LALLDASAAAPEKSCNGVATAIAANKNDVRSMIRDIGLTRIRRIDLQMHVKMKIHDRINFETRCHDFTPLQQKDGPGRL
jgi:hypothetical protein